MARRLLCALVMRRFAATVVTSLSVFMALQLGTPAHAGEVDPEEPNPARVVEPMKVEAPAVPPTVPVSRTAPAERSWYGWQILLADAASFACVGVTEQEACLLGFALSGPVVHTLHGRPGRGLASLGLRVGLPLIGALIGSAVANCPEEPPAPPPSNGNGHGSGFGTVSIPSFCGLSEVALGTMIGAAGAMAVDGVLAFTDGEPAREASKPSRYAFSPRLAVGQNNVAMGIGGTF